jgi:hypothetical protein
LFSFELLVYLFIIVMQLRSDLSIAHVVDSNRIPFVDSPVPGVQRRMLDRTGNETARATTIVRYAPFARFSRHTHSGGEEFVVLDGIFSDEISGDHGPMSYCRHGIGTEHEPWTGEQGALLLVKLRQMNDRTETPITFVDTTSSTDWTNVDGDERRQRLDLFASEKTGECVWMERWISGFSTAQWIVRPGGEEIFVLKGDMTFSNVDGSNDENNQHQCTDAFWIRRPPQWDGRRFNVKTDHGCLLFIKSGHLSMNLDSIN